jgi:hypothetical protein
MAFWKHEQLPSKEQKAARPSNFLDARLLQAHTPLLAADTRHVSRKPTTTKSSSRDKRIDTSERPRACPLRKAARTARSIASRRESASIMTRHRADFRMSARAGLSRLTRDLTRELATFACSRTANDTPARKSNQRRQAEWRETRVSRGCLSARAPSRVT